MTEPAGCDDRGAVSAGARIGVGLVLVWAVGVVLIVLVPVIGAITRFGATVEAVTIDTVLGVLTWRVPLWLFMAAWLLSLPRVRAIEGALTRIARLEEWATATSGSNDTERLDELESRLDALERVRPR
jgi:hypothetical protein